MSPVQLNAATCSLKNAAGSRVQSRRVDGRRSFEDTLRAEVSKGVGVKLSAHARKRLSDRNVAFGPREQERLSAAVDRIEQKGADKSLVLMDDLALLVSARNRTVITALDSASAKDAVFTNIDSAVVI